MKKLGLCMILALALIFGVSSAGHALVCVDLPAWCNDLVFVPSTPTSGIYGIHGYEYGCGYKDRLVDGTLLVTGGYAYVGILGSCGKGSGGHDAGALKMDNYIITLSTKQGSGNWQYLYLDGGVPAGHSGTANVTLNTSCTPALGEAIDAAPDSAE